MFVDANFNNNQFINTFIYTFPIPSKKLFFNLSLPVGPCDLVAFSPCVWWFVFVLLKDLLSYMPLLIEYYLCLFKHAQRCPFRVFETAAGSRDIKYDWIHLEHTWCTWIKHITGYLVSLAAFGNQLIDRRHGTSTDCYRVDIHLFPKLYRDWLKFRNMEHLVEICF